MPKVSEPRVTIRLGEADHARLAGLADGAGVALGYLIRECAIRYGAEVAAELRGASGQRGKIRRVATRGPRRRPHVAEPPSSPAGSGRALAPTRPEPDPSPAERARLVLAAQEVAEREGISLEAALKLSGR